MDQPITQPNGGSTADSTPQATPLPTFSVRRPFWGSIQLLADGVPLKGKGRSGTTYLLPMPDGSMKEIGFRGLYGGAKVVVDGVEQRIEPDLPRWLVVLAVLPLGLAFIGGLIGGIVGGVASIINYRIAGLAMHAGAKTGLMFVVAAIAALSWYGIVLVVSGSSTVGVGSCVNGVRLAPIRDPNAVRVVDCGPAHDAELFAEFEHPAAATYPGSAALQAFAVTNCLPAFETYVGIPLSQSTFDVLPLFPTTESWSSGRRTVSCFVVQPDGSKVTGSVRGTQR